MAKNASGTSVDFVGDGSRKRPMMLFVAISRIHRVPGINPRTERGDCTSLKSSMKDNGPIGTLVCRTSVIHPGDYDLICGDRRLHCAEELKWPEHPIQVHDWLGDDDRASNFAVAENNSEARTSLTAWDEAKKFKKSKDAGKTSAEIAKECGGYSPQHVNRTLKILETPERLQQMAASRQLSKMALIAFASFSADVQTKIEPMVEPNMSEDDLRRLARTADTDLSAGGAQAKGSEGMDPGDINDGESGSSGDDNPPGDSSGKSEKKGKPRAHRTGSSSAIPISRGAREGREKVLMIASDVMTLDEELSGKTDEPLKLVRHERLGAIAGILYLLGEVDEPDTTAADFKRSWANLKKEVQAKIKAKGEK